MIQQEFLTLGSLTKKNKKKNKKITKRRKAKSS